MKIRKINKDTICLFLLPIIITLIGCVDFEVLDALLPTTHEIIHIVISFCVIVIPLIISYKLINSKKP